MVLPKDNEQDLRDLPANVREELQITLAETIEDALAVTLPELGRRLKGEPVEV